MDSNQSFALFNGNFIEKGSLHFDYKINVYEAQRIQDGIVLFAEEYFERLQNSLKIAQLDVHTTFAIWEQRLYEVVKKNNITHGNIRTDLFITANNEIVEYISLYNAKYPSLNDYQNGVATILQFDNRVNPNAKITNNAVRGKAESLISQAHVYETILVDEHQNLTEGSRTNLFAIKNNELITAPDQMVLCGIMRLKVLMAAKNLHLKITFSPIKVDDLTNMDALFLTGTSPRVLWINKVDSYCYQQAHPYINALLLEIEAMVLQYVEGKKRGR